METPPAAAPAAAHQKLLDPDSRPKPFSSSFPNGALKKHHLRSLPPPESLYRECLKNHAATLGGHALDGCGEFMPVPSSTPSDPTSLKCAACGCHRNFHRRLPDPPPDELDRHTNTSSDNDRHISDDDDISDASDDDAGGAGTTTTPSPPAAYFSSAPHMLLALSTGGPGPASQGAPLSTGPNPNPNLVPPMALSAPGPVRTLNPSFSPGTGPLGPLQARKRFRTKFSAEQKQRMHELSEKLGWRLQKRDEALVEEWCREIGVGKGVFKVWMHNNKHVFLGTGKRGESKESRENRESVKLAGVGLGIGDGGNGAVNGNGGGGGGGGGAASS